jgi:hypothetical protein
MYLGECKVHFLCSPALKYNTSKRDFEAWVHHLRHLELFFPLFVTQLRILSQVLRYLGKSANSKINNNNESAFLFRAGNCFLHSLKERALFCFEKFGEMLKKRFVTLTWVARISWYKIPKRREIYEMTTKYTKWP